MWGTSWAIRLLASLARMSVAISGNAKRMYPVYLLSGCRQPHVKLAAGGFRIAQQCLRARQHLTAFKPGDRGLAGPHPGSQLSLREACAQASPEQLGGDLELRRERVILRPDFRAAQKASLELFERDCHGIYFARAGCSRKIRSCIALTSRLSREPA